MADKQKPPGDGDNDNPGRGRSADPFDAHVGVRLRARRIALGLSQEKLGEALGVTFQQVQKYEKGTNRLGASRLRRSAEVLRVPPAYFFDGAEDKSDGVRASGVADGADSSYELESVDAAEGLALLRAFQQVLDPKVRRHVVAVVEAIAAAQPAPTPPSKRRKSKA